MKTVLARPKKSRGKNRDSNGTACTFVLDEDQVVIPAWVNSLESFRQWAESDDFPETGRVWYLQGEVWVDMSKEQMFWHVEVKGEYTMTLRLLARAEDSGFYFTGGLFLRNDVAGVAGQPDGTFVLHNTLESAVARLIEGKQGGHVELVGTPDMVLEIVSHGSVKKDTVLLKQAYWEAGISEYWLVDARQEPPLFTIFRRTSRGYVAVRAKDGWLKSEVFGKSFRLTQNTSKSGLPQFKLEVR